MKFSSARKTILLLFLSITAIFATVVSFAQNGSLDAGFGKNGKAITDFGGAKDFATCIALQTDNKIIVGGYVTLAAKQYFALARYKANGKLDGSFGNGGKVTTGFEGINEVYLESITLQPDQKIIAGGYLIDGEYDNFVLVRYKADGHPDSTFGENAIIITPLTATESKVTSVVVEPGGAILVAGNINCKPAVRRYEPGGVPSLFFAQLGIDVSDLDDECYHVNSMFLFATGHLLLSGENTGTSDNMFLMELDPEGNGKVDSAFGTNGIVKTNISDTSGVFASLLQPDGKILVAGFAIATGTGFREFLVARYKPTGVLDSSFGANGVTLVPFSANAVAKSISLESDGKIIITGNVYAENADKIVWFVLDSNGTVDLSYGNGSGEVILDNANGDDAVASVIQPDGKLVIAGYTLSSDSTGYNFIIARFNTAESLPVTLTSFTATAAKSTVLLNWQTATETNNSYFSIERGGNSSNFTAIGKVDGKGNFNQLQQYAYSDVQPLKGDNFYRLKQLDKDGRYSYSKTVHIFFGTEPNLHAYPNPAKNTIKVSSLSAGATLAVTGMTGKAMGLYTATGAEYTINIQNLPAGIYFIHVQQGGKTTTLKVVKE